MVRLSNKSVRRLPGALVLLAASMLFAAACAPSPKNTPCSNDGECAAADDAFRYCLQSRCVECVGSSSCEGGKCVDGACEIPCKNDGSCPKGRVCKSDMCELR
ncbi:MAG: hypothetical protein R3B70_25495 [Polyangiaceae bacterium]